MNISYTQQGCHPLWFKSEREINQFFHCHEAVGLCLTFYKSLMCVQGPSSGISGINLCWTAVEVLVEMTLTVFDCWTAGDGHRHGSL